MPSRLIPRKTLESKEMVQKRIIEAAIFVIRKHQETSGHLAMTGE
jgi:uncharacterized protein YtpQ (UPF0354 family)